MPRSIKWIRVVILTVLRFSALFLRFGRKFLADVLLKSLWTSAGSGDCKITELNWKFQLKEVRFFDIRDGGYRFTLMKKGQILSHREKLTGIPSKLSAIFSLWNSSVGPKKKLAISRNFFVISRNLLLFQGSNCSHCQFFFWTNRTIP